ncbi:ClbS/DfsB family four-helix bundle protein [Actinotalea sp. K2]|uniref:ClbS/DfsB family four-helix bundle protein n=1 Tax=Actinotalea sp. K2 TaxID=2939438 RepID=UPI002017516C|nr:ClbS/DfsB family four-helix bundle protein [Actinotalea sp. K2]MCL3860704.1 ClbS/DfsB family four-helix bundle protein [Actinotalea sp. K2]
MPRATTRDELLASSDRAYTALATVLDRLPRTALQAPFPFEDRDRCVRDVLGHLHAWHLMMLGWYDEGSRGLRPAIPAPGHTWRTLPALNQEIWERYQEVDLSVVRADLDASHRQIQDLIGRHTDAELFTKRLYPWTGTTSLGAYLVSATASHYTWAVTKLRRFERVLTGG